MNLRVVLTGVLMIVMALAFFFGMEVALAPKSNDPAAMMQTVGTVSGAVGGIGLVMVVFGALRKKKG
jgi:hypothetical protein